MKDWKSTVAGTLSFLNVTLTAVSGFLAAMDINNGGSSLHSIHTSTWIVAGVNLALALVHAWIGWITQNASAPAVAAALAAPAFSPASTPTAAQLTATPPVGILASAQPSALDSETRGNIVRLVVLGLCIGLSGCATATAPGTPAAPQSPYQKAATLMDDFATDLQSAQQTEISLFKGGAIDAGTHQSIEGVFKMVAGFGPQIDALLTAQASAQTIATKVNAALNSLNSIAISTGKIDAGTAAQIKAGIQALNLLLTQILPLFPAA